MATWEDVRRIASGLPAVEESTTYRQPCFKVNGRMFVSVSSREDGAIVTRAPSEEVELLLRARPDVYFVTPHYQGWDGLLARLDAIEEDELAGRLEDAWEYITRRVTKTRHRSSG